MPVNKEYRFTIQTPRGRLAAATELLQEPEAQRLLASHGLTQDSTISRAALKRLSGRAVAPSARLPTVAAALALQLPRSHRGTGDRVYTLSATELDADFARIALVGRGSASLARRSYVQHPAVLARHAQPAGTFRREITSGHVLQVAKRILREDQRFVGNKSDDLKAIDDAEEPTPGTPLSTRTVQKLRKRITDDLVGMMDRPQVVLQNVPAGQRYTQECAHVHHHEEGYLELVVGRTLSSESIKDDHHAENAHMREYNANSAVIVSDQGKIIWRSARADTAKKLEEKVVGASIAALEAAGGDLRRAHGFVETAPDTWEFRPTIISALDVSWIKRLIAQIANFFGIRIEIEPRFVKNMRRAADELFPGHAMARKIKVGDRLIEVTIRKPVIVNITLSGMSRFSSSITAHRKGNRDDALRLFDDLTDTWCQRTGNTRASKAVVALGGAMRRARQGDVAALQAFFDGVVSSRSRTHRLHVQHLSPKDRMALDYLCITMTHLNRAATDTQGRDLLGRQDPGVEAQLLKHLLDVTGSAPGVECKSGLDRTLQLVGMFVALDQFERTSTSSTPFVPRNSEKEDKRFRALFTNAANEFGKPMLEQVRGIGASAKWDDGLPHYVAAEWYNATPGNPIGRFAWARGASEADVNASAAAA